MKYRVTEREKEEEEKGKKNEKKRKEDRSSIYLFTPQMAALANPGPG